MASKGRAVVRRQGNKILGDMTALAAAILAVPHSDSSACYVSTLEAQDKVFNLQQELKAVLQQFLSHDKQSVG